MGQTDRFDERPAARPIDSVSADDTVESLASGEVPKKKPGCFAIGCGTIVMLLIIGGVIGAMSAKDGSKSKHTRNSEAAITCQRLVKENLKAPSTADFVGFPDVSGVTVKGQVDAENGFGAKIRSSFQCTIVDDQVRLDYLR